MERDIRITTNRALTKAVKRHSKLGSTTDLSGRFPPPLDTDSSFFGAYLPKVEGRAESFITTKGRSLTISTNSNAGETLAFVVIDFRPGKPAAIVKPGFYNEAGERDQENGKMARSVLRNLTEPEGIGLLRDLKTLQEQESKIRRQRI